MDTPARKYYRAGAPAGRKLLSAGGPAAGLPEHYLRMYFSRPPCEQKRIQAVQSVPRCIIHPRSAVRFGAVSVAESSIPGLDSFGRPHPADRHCSSAICRRSRRTPAVSAFRARSALYRGRRTFAPPVSSSWSARRLRMALFPPTIPSRFTGRRDTCRRAIAGKTQPITTAHSPSRRPFCRLAAGFGVLRPAQQRDPCVEIKGSVPTRTRNANGS